MDWDFPEDLVEPKKVDTASNESNYFTIDDCIKAGKNGVEISNERYHSTEGISGSNLELLAESNKHLDNKELFNLGESDAFTEGTCLHTLVLEPHDVNKNYAILPTGLNLRTNSGKEEKKLFIDSNKKKICLDYDVFSKLERMTENVMAICGDIISDGIKERSYFAKDDELLLKIRPDCYCSKTGNEWDLKSITPKYGDMSDGALERKILSLNYHISAGFRNYVRKLLGMPTGKFNLIFVSKSPGHMVRNIKIADKLIEEAELKVKKMMDGRKFYLSTGIDTSVSTIDRSSRKYE
jgi:hypothetical protein